MRACVIFLMAGGLIGCSSTPLELPTCEIPEAPEAAQYALSLPEMPVEVSTTAETATFDLPGLLQLERFRRASVTNKIIADENALALEARNESVNALIECSRYTKIWMEVREDMLEQERQDHWLDNLWHRGVIVLGAIAVAL